MDETPATIGAAMGRAAAVTSARHHGHRTPRLLAIGGLVGALGAASCCVFPFALFLAGVSGAWIGDLTALEPYQPIFAGVSLAFVGYGAWHLRRKREIACADGYCATPQSDRIAKIGLWTAGVLVVLAVGFPYAARYFL